MRREDINQLLNDVSPDENWTHITNEIDSSYDNKNKNPQRFWEFNKDFRKKFYSQAIPNHLEVMRKINGYMNKKRQEIDIVHPEVYDYGIYLIGFSEDPIILSLGFMRPRNIYFIYSEESEKMLELLIEGFSYFDEEMRERIEKALQEGYKTKLRDSSDPAETFKTIKNIVQNIRSKGKDKRIMVDITGGKKTMVSGAFSSSSLLKDVDIIYVDFGSYNDMNRKPEYCTEFISKLQNPNNIYRYTDLERIKGLFDSHRYDVAYEDIKKQLDVMDKFSTEYYDEEIVKLRELKKWADIYKAWDQFRYSEVLKYIDDITIIHKLDGFEKLLEQLGNRFNFSNVNNPSYILQLLLQDVKDRKEYSDNLFKFIAVDRYCNAKRRKGTDNEGCIVRLCSIIEILTYYYLIKNHSFLDIVEKEESKEVIIQDEKVLEIICGDYESRCMPGKLSNVSDRIKLLTKNKISVKEYIFKWKENNTQKRILSNSYLLKEIKGINIKRNQSSITHSVGFIGDEEINGYIKAIKEFIKKIFEMNDSEFSSFEERIRFRREEEIVAAIQVRRTDECK